MPSGVKEKAFVSDFSITALGGLMQSFGDLVTIVETEARKAASPLTSACPACDKPAKVKQGYQCDAGHGPFPQNQLKKMREITKGSFVFVDGAAIAEAKKVDLPKNMLELGVFQREQVEPYVKRTGTSYVFRDSGRGTLFPVLVHLLRRRPDLVFVGQANIKESESLCLVEIGLNGQLVVQTIEWPGDVRVFDAPALIEVKTSLLETAEKLIEGEVTDFTPETFVKGTRAKLSEVLAAAANGATTEGLVLVTDTPTLNLDNLEELLRQSLERKAS